MWIVIETSRGSSRICSTDTHIPPRVLHCVPFPQKTKRLSKMKVSATICAFALASSSLLSVTFARELAEAPTEPCAPTDEEEDDDDPNECLDDKAVCTTAQDQCCEGLVCAGFSFFKHCQTPPVCHEM